jgi:hypothetical protein
VLFHPFPDSGAADAKLAARFRFIPVTVFKQIFQFFF